MLVNPTDSIWCPTQYPSGCYQFTLMVVSRGERAEMCKLQQSNLLHFKDFLISQLFFGRVSVTKYFDRTVIYHHNSQRDVNYFQIGGNVTKNNNMEEMWSFTLMKQKDSCNEVMFYGFH